MITALIVEVGAVNVPGPAGPTGATGPQGSIGPRGDKGSPGEYVQGMQGPPGSTFLYGAVAPTAGLGNDGDYYIRTDTGDLYRKVDTAWGSPIANFVSIGPEALSALETAVNNRVRFDTVDVLDATERGRVFDSLSIATNIRGFLTGTSIITGGLGVTSHLHTYGWGGNNNAALIYMGIDGSKYLYGDGSNLHFAGFGTVFGPAIQGTSITSTGSISASGVISTTSNIIATGTVNAGGAISAGGAVTANNGRLWGASDNAVVLGNGGPEPGHKIQFGWNGTTGVPNYRISTWINSVYNGTLAIESSTVTNKSGTNNKLEASWDGQFKFWVDGSNVKTFVIDHPLDPDRYLVHACLEGPESAVFYRGKGVLTGLTTEIALPDYFTALVDEDSATVQVTPIVTHEGAMAPLAASEIRDGRFMVARMGGSEHQQPFHWRVEATRRDVSQFDIEPRKDQTTVRGDGPYRYTVG